MTAEYLMKIMGFTLCSVILANVIPEGRTSALIKNIVRLSVYVCILSPIFAFLIDFERGEKVSFQIFPNYFSESVIDTDEEYVYYRSEAYVREAEATIENELFIAYDVSANVTLEVRIDENDYGIRIEKICVFPLRKYTNERLNELKEKLEKKYSVKAEIIKEEEYEMGYS